MSAGGRTAPRSLVVRFIHFHWKQGADYGFRRGCQSPGYSDGGNGGEVFFGVMVEAEVG